MLVALLFRPKGHLLSHRGASSLAACQCSLCCSPCLNTLCPQLFWVSVHTGVQWGWNCSRGFTRFIPFFSFLFSYWCAPWSTQREREEGGGEGKKQSQWSDRSELMSRRDPQAKYDSHKHNHQGLRTAWSFRRTESPPTILTTFCLLLPSLIIYKIKTMHLFLDMIEST